MPICLPTPGPLNPRQALIPSGVLSVDLRSAKLHRGRASLIEALGCGRREEKGREARAEGATWTLMA